VDRLVKAIAREAREKKPLTLPTLSLPASPPT